MNIAVLGGGISGLASAHFAAQKASVTIYEKEAQLGGHANTALAHFNDVVVPVDAGFMVYNPEQYPEFVKLLDELGVQSSDTQMSFSVELADGFMFKSDFPSGVFVKRKHLWSLRFWRFLAEIVRFHYVAKKTLRSKIGVPDTLGEYLKKHKISDDLFRQYLHPMISAIWSCPDPQSVKSFSALSTLVFLNNHKLLNFKHPQWKTIRDGSRSYVSALENSLRQQGVIVKTSTPIDSIERSGEKVTITAEGVTTLYDYVISALHADTLLSLLKDATAEESTALSAFSYSRNETFLHSDVTYRPVSPSSRAAWNYQERKTATSEIGTSFTYDMNVLQAIPDEFPLLVTLNPSTPINPALVHGHYKYHHPVYSAESVRGQSQIASLQGVNRLFYSGAHLGYGFHEDGVVSAHAACQALFKKL